jgi:hypothetical protein
MSQPLITLLISVCGAQVPAFFGPEPAQSENRTHKGQALLPAGEGPPGNNTTSVRGIHDGHNR